MRIERSGPADCRIWDDGELIAEIEALRLTFFRARRGSEPIIGATVPLPLYWQQYADHQDPERNLSSGGALVAGRIAEEMAEVVCTGTTASGSAHSTFRLRTTSPGDGIYELHVSAELTVPGAGGWTVTPNPHHGELEFCNLWPERTFVPANPVTKRYRMCAVRGSSGVLVLRHHHLESDDKHNITMHEGDEAAWLLEDENPAVHIDASPEVTAGLCAYMWDMHFAYRVCTANAPVVLPRGFRAEARYTIRSISRTAGELWLRTASAPSAKGLDRVPVYVRGLNTFKETFASADITRTDLWPWVFDVLRGSPDAVMGERDSRTGYDDHASLVIRATAEGSGRWSATTLGPAFGEPPFPSGRRYRLSARVRCVGGQAHIALAVHRTDAPGLYDASTYEEFSVSAPPSGPTGWALCVVVTPAIEPAPDRMHIRLTHEGEGASWFDNVLCEEFD